MVEVAQADLGRELALLLLRYRFRNGNLSQRQLADVLGWKQPQVALVELGGANPTIKTLRHLADKLGCEINIVMVGSRFEVSISWPDN